ncbi:MAG: DNA-processing protein DprA [Ignavibacteriae bacterium]|nr:DNA-processing protein DprA [Ignavibacteriota bacterium]
MNDSVYENFSLVYFLKNITNLGDVRIRKIVEKYHSLDSLLKVNKDHLMRIEGLNEKVCQEIYYQFDKITEVRKAIGTLLSKCSDKKISYTTILDDDYPFNLRNIYDAPVLLYYMGKLSEKDRYSISIVGTRTPSDYGRRVCVDITKELSRKGIPVISGLAIGIDSIAHNTCVDNENLTYAVLGSGVDNLYPPDNRLLYNRIIETGAVVSEFDVGTKAEKVNFPRRNRVVSGISLGTIIVESGAKGGSLITAEFALDQNKELFAIPGNINARNSEGCNNLIKKGYAKLVMNVDDVLSELSYKIGDLVENKVERAFKKENPALNIFETKIYNVLNETEPINVDRICELTELNVSDCLVNLLTMEFKGLVSQLPGKYFIRI